MVLALLDKLSKLGAGEWTREPVCGAAEPRGGVALLLAQLTSASRKTEGWRKLYDFSSFSPF